MAIDNVVVLMLENRSFDHVFGFRPGVNGLKGTETNLLDPTKPESTSNPAFKVSNAEPYSISAGQGPAHALNDVTVQLFGSKSAGAAASMNGFVENYRDSLLADHVANPTAAQIEVVMESFAPGTLPALQALADNFVLCDNWFCEVPGPTMPNRMYVHMGTSAGYVHNVWDHIFDQPTIYNRLEDAGKTWAVYSFDQNEVKQLSQANPARFKDFETSFQADLTSGAFPNYSFIVPRFFAKDGPVNSMHGPFDARPADQLVAQVYNLLRAGPVWATGMLVVTFDEHGGFYDHVAPPSQNVPNPDGIDSPPPGDTASWVPAFGFDRLGLRVPTLIVSPWVGKGEVASNQYQHTSILATLGKLFGTKSLTKRDASARPFDELFLGEARTDAPASIASVEVTPSPTGFGVGMETDHGNFGLDHLQHEMVLGAHSRMKLRSSIATIPETQRAAADFVRGV